MEVVFTMPVDPVTGGDPGNFTLNGGLDVLAAERDADDLKVVNLKTDPQTVGSEYTLYVENVEDTLGNPLPDVDSASFWGGVIPITTVQSDTADSGLSAWEDRRVTISGIIIADSTSSSWWWAQMAQGGDFSGIQAYDYDYEPVIGDSVIAVGEILEYYNQTELASVVYCEIVSSGNDTPPPETLMTGDLAFGAVGLEGRESILVQILDAIVVDANPGGAYWLIDDGSGVCYVANRTQYSYEPQDGDTVSVRGPTRFAYGSMQVEPRGDYDLWGSAVQEDGGSPLRGRTVRMTLSPNPMMKGGEVQLALPEKGEVHLNIYNASGRRVREVFSGVLEAGSHSMDIGPGLPSGVYFAGLQAGRKWKVRKFTVLGQ
jgi:hypothetical protein